MFVDFLVEHLAQRYRVFACGWSLVLVLSSVEPEVNPIKKVKPGPINDKAASRLLIRPEEDSGSKYPLETFHDSVIAFAVLEEVEEIEDLGSRTKSDNTSMLADGHGGDPDRDEPILAVREAKLRMADNLKEESSVAPCVGQLIRSRAAERETTKNKRSSVESKLLIALLALLTDELYGVEPPCATGRDTNVRQNFANGDKGGRETAT